MITHVAPPVGLAQSYRGFLDALGSAGFRGEISSTYADRTVLATDNSIYQRLPQAIVFPRDAEDVAARRPPCWRAASTEVS